MTKDLDKEWLKLAELVRKVQEQKARATEAREAQKCDADRDAFRHRGMGPIKPAKLRF